MIAPKMPSRTLDNIDFSTRIVPVQKAFSLFTRRSHHRPIHGLRLNGELVRALNERPPTTPAERIRLAELTIDSDQACDVSLLVAAARDAIALTNITLGERLARAAVSRGGGLAASELLARSLLWQGNAVEAEEALRPFHFDELNDRC